MLCICLFWVKETQGNIITASKILESYHVEERFNSFHMVPEARMRRGVADFCSK